MTWILWYFGVVSLLLFAFRGLLILRLKDRYYKQYRILGEPNYSDLFLTKAGRALLLFLVKGGFRSYEDRLLVMSAWLTLLVLFFSYAGMGVVVMLAHLCPIV